MYPIQEEEVNDYSVDREVYKNIILKAYNGQKETGCLHRRKFAALSKLNELIEDIEAFKNGNYIVIN